MLLIDTHAHLDDERLYDQLSEVLNRAVVAGVRQIITVGYDLASSRAAVGIAEENPGVFAAVGIHPHDAVTASEEALQDLRNLAQHPKVVAWGEIGLDYYYDNSPREQQRQAFIRQIALANELGLPVIIHSRDAQADTLAILCAARPRKGVLHCYSGSLEMARELFDLGLCFGAGGPITFKNAKRPVEVFGSLPLERILLETDSPYLAPVPYRGKVNEPAYMLETARKLAAIHKSDLAEVALVTTQNARRLFGLPEDEVVLENSRPPSVDNRSSARIENEEGETPR